MVSKILKIGGYTTSHSTFLLGTTRDNFEGKKVIQLEYEAYIPMAEKKMREICDQIHEMWNVEKVAMVHRIG